jgi:hypothetical protein
VGNSTGSNTGTNNQSSNGTGSTTGTSSGTSTGSGTNTGTTTGSGTNPSTTTGSGTNTNTNTNNSSGTNTATTGGTTTTGGFTQTGGSTDTGSNTNTSTTNGSNTNTATSTGSNTNTGSSTGTSSGTNTSANTSTGSNSGSNANNNTSVSTQSGGSDNSSSAQGGYNTNRQTISPAATESSTKTEGKREEKNLSLSYQGIGSYQNIAVPKSDAGLLMGLVRNYLLFNGAIPTVPTDPRADILVYVTVDVFGTVRSRFDALAYNNESVRAETSFEISAFDREGKMIMAPKVANREARFMEHYLFWAGPFVTQEKVSKGKGLLVDFTDVDGSKATYPVEEKDVNYPLWSY